MPVNCPGGQIYVVKKGDSLFKLARRFNTTVQEIMRVNPQIADPNLIFPGQEICIPVPQGPPPPVPRPRYVLLHPTDMTPNSKGMVFVEPDLNSVFALVTNVPEPNILPEGEVYKLWVIKPVAAQNSVADMEQVYPNYWIARLIPGFPLTGGADVLISAEKRANNTAPAGMGVAVGTI